MGLLASPAPDKAFFRAEAAFSQLDPVHRVEMLMAYEPEIFQVETTTQCNLNCPLCSTHHLRRGHSETPLGMIEKIVGDNPRIRYMCLHLMGEPLLSKSLFSIIRYLGSKNIFTYFSTNGLLLDEKVDEILSSGLDKISISLDGINQEDLARYRIGADFNKILKGILRLKERRDSLGLSRPLIQIQTIMFSYNEMKESEVVAFLKSLGVDRIKLKKPSFDTFGGKNDGEGRFLKEGADAAGKYSRANKSYMKYRDRVVCRLLFQGFALSDGSVVPCCIDFDGEYSFGNLNHQPWQDIWSSEKRREILMQFFIEKLPLCKTCSLGYEYSTTVYDRAAITPS